MGIVQCTCTEAGGGKGVGAKLVKIVAVALYKRFWLIARTLPYGIRFYTIIQLVVLSCVSSSLSEHLILLRRTVINTAKNKTTRTEITTARCSWIKSRIMVQAVYGVKVDVIVLILVSVRV